MKRTRLILLRRLLLVLCVLTAVWAVFVWWTGGVIFRVGAMRVSSRNPRNVFIIVLLCAAALRVLSSPQRAGPMRGEWIWWGELAKAHGRLLRRAGRLLLPLASAVTIAVIGISIDVHQWAGPPPLWLDEETIALNIRDRSFVELAGPLWLGQSAPLGWLIVQRAIVLALGTSELALRLVPLLFGVATIAAAGWIGRRWMGRAATAVLVLLCWVAALMTHYRFEVKHYTADAFFGLLLPALAIWTIEAGHPALRTRRAIVWWGAAAAGHFLANGALFVTPACAAFLLVLVWRRDGRRAATSFVMAGLLWLASFVVHYLLSIRHTHHSRYLRGFWASALPPDGAGWSETIRWLIDRFEPLAGNPGATAWWTSLWLLAIGGFAFSRRRALGGIFATVPLSAFAFAAFRIVPLRERQALWIVPSLYVGVALAVDAAVRYGRDALKARSVLRAGAAAVVLLVALHLSRDISRGGWRHREIERPRHSKQWFNDALGVRWLMRHYQPGDALIATRLTWPAVWWYGEISIGSAAGARHLDPQSMYEAAYMSLGSECDPGRLRDVLKSHRRVLVYFGFRDERPGFDDLLLRELNQLGAMTAVNEFAKLSRAAVVEIGAPPSEAVAEIPRGLITPGRQPPLEGCIDVRPAGLW